MKQFFKKNKQSIYLACLAGAVSFLAIITFFQFNKKIEESISPIKKEIIKNREKIEEVEGKNKKNEEEINSLKTSTTENFSLLQDSINTLKREIEILRKDISQEYKKQKEINEYWGKKTLELINWKLDLEEKEEEKKKEEKIVFKKGDIPRVKEE